MAEQFDLHTNQIIEWKKQLQEQAASVFGGSDAQVEPADLKPLHAKIGQAIDVLNEVFAKYDAPQIINTDQGRLVYHPLLRSNGEGQ